MKLSHEKHFISLTFYRYFHIFYFTVAGMLEPSFRQSKKHTIIKTQEELFTLIIQSKDFHKQKNPKL